MSFNVKSEIMAAIAKTNDENMKMLLLLMLGVLEEIGGRIDGMRADEQGLRDAVLNGHASSHDRHHEWIEERMASNCSDGCAWANRKMAEEKKAIEDNATSARKIRDGLIEKMLWVTLVAVAGSGWFLK